jgi:hypothetical protein
MKHSAVERTRSPSTRSLGGGPPLAPRAAIANDGAPPVRPALVRPALATLACALAALTVGCGAARPSQPPGVPPTPKSITPANPGGDAFDPELAALQRLVEAPFGARTDEFRTLRVPMPDWKNWARITVFGVPTRAVFRYGDDRIGLGGLLYREAEGASDPASCLNAMVAKATAAARMLGLSIRASPDAKVPYRFQGKPGEMVIRKLDGSIDSFFATDDYAGAVASYPTWPGMCLVYGYAVKATNHPELAAQARDRWVTDGARRLRWERKIKEAPKPLEK